MWKNIKMANNLLKRCSVISNYRTNLSRSFTRTTTATAKTQQDLVQIDLNESTSIAHLTLNRLPANALNLEFMHEIRRSIEQLKKARCDGIILSSASERIFCAGLDLNEVYQPDLKRLPEFWLALRNMWQSLFSAGMPTVALINGHATAGGCMLAICCDYRVMLPKFLIGLNETNVGIAVPKWVIDNYVHVISNCRIAEADLIQGKLYDSEAALRVGLVDALVPTKEAGIEKSLQFLSECRGAERNARAKTKLLFREGILQDFEKNRKQDIERFVENIQREEVQRFLGEYLKTFGKKSKKPL